MADAPHLSHDINGWPRSHVAPRISALARPGRTVGWDLLLVCVAIHIANYIGRVPQLFPVLDLLKLAPVAKVLAIGLYLLHQSGQRRVGLLRSSATTSALGLLLWAGLSIPAALYPGLAFHAWTDFAWTVVMCLVVTGSARSVRDVERLVLVYFSVTALLVAVILSRFQLGADSWRLGDLYYYDANDLATLIVSAMPCGLYFVLAQRRPLVRVCAALGLVVLAVGLTRSGSRGGFLAFLAVVAFILLRFTTLPARSRLVGLGVGMSNFQVAEGTISPLAKRRERGLAVYWTAPHNTFIQAGAELGVPGLLLFIGLFATAFASLRRVARRARSATPPDGDVARLGQTLTAALVGFVVGAFFLSLAYTDMLYMLLAFVVALGKVARGRWRTV